MLATAIELMERGYVPDWLTRVGIRRLLAERLRGAEHAAVRARLEADEVNILRGIVSALASPTKPNKVD